MTDPLACAVQDTATPLLTIVVATFNGLSGFCAASIFTVLEEALNPTAFLACT